MSSESRFPRLQPNLQISLYSRLQALRKLYLRDALRAAVEDEGFDLALLDSDLARYVPAKHLKRLAASGLRGETVFPVPYLLAKNPYLLGYYRLLLGFSQKAFYGQGPFSKFKALEERGTIPALLEAVIPALCVGLIEAAALLLPAIDPLSSEIMHDLQLLTLGPQLRGSRNVGVGQEAVDLVIDLLKGLLARYSPQVTRRRIAFSNDSGLPVTIQFGSDPDVSITQKLGSEERRLLALEIKGGADVSNIWNRLGEAEKSHRTAKAAGFNELWTVTGVDLDGTKETRRTAHEKSPTTTRFFYLARVSDSASAEGTLFRQVLGSIIGAKLG
jgi:hypothetical protein